MAFSRGVAPMLSEVELTAHMVGIGMKFAGPAQRDADIENAVVAASVLGMQNDDLRVLAVLTTWLGLHHPYLNADRLIRLVRACSSARAKAYWAAVAIWLKKDRRFARLAVGVNTTVDLLPVGTDFQIARHGQDERFAASRLRVPAGTLRNRPEDVLSPAHLLQAHAGYRNRVCMGPTFRADIWTALEQKPEESIADIARKVGCSFSTAWQVAQDFRLAGSQF